MLRPFIAFLLITSLSSLDTYAQSDTIRLVNGSFEDVPQQSAQSIKGWYDCGKINFINETAPDIHPGKFWENNLPASDRNTYLGMVVRDNGSYESVSQRLEGTLEAGQCYTFTLHLARAPKYVSLSHITQEYTNYTTPAVLRIWGGLGYCNERELLAESTPVSNDSWQIFKFEFKPKSTVRSLTFQAYYKTPVLIPYNGNILVDGGSHIIKKSCNGDIASAKSNLPPHKRKKTPTTSTGSTARTQDTPVIASTNTSNKPKIMTELNRATIKEGQTIEIKKLEFAADTSAISKPSFEVLEELYHFLVNNPGVIIEIGGHTNNVPSDTYCDRLSTARAKAVAEYLVNRGINSEKIQFKGYGKKMPVADNKTVLGRQRNQRVEIKILGLS
jgi:outer membrane protein OmpA-like peptidoglycan-associated protein